METPKVKLGYFTSKETKCKCGNCDYDITPAFRAKMNEIRSEYGQPITIVSGARCPEHNAKPEIKGAKNSAHIIGVAADLKRNDDLLTFLMTRLDKFNIAIEDPNKTPSWIHVTTRLPANNKRIIYI